MAGRTWFDRKGNPIQFAKLKHAEGTLVLPATTPHDKDNLLEEISIYAGRHGAVTVETSHPQQPTFLVRSLKPQESIRCSRCGCPSTLSFRDRGDRLCRVCAKELLHGL